MKENYNYTKNGQTISEEEMKNFTSFYNYLVGTPKKVRVIFRGENYENLSKKLNLYGQNDYIKLSNFIFLVGEKGRVYREEYKNKIKNKDKIYSIDCVTDEFFKRIFEKLNIILKSEKPEVVEFREDNKNISSYFSNILNKSDFLKIIKSNPHQKEKIKIRDYYLNLLHQIGRIGFYNNSFFVSTTTDFEIAEKVFANNSNNSESLIFVSWVKKPINHIGVNFNYLNKFKNRVEALGLPTYEKSFFPGQNEISVKGGLLPHYILGYIRLEKMQFEINPNFFSTSKNYDDIIMNGLDIDQSNFNSAIIETDYSGYFILLEYDTYFDINN